LKLINARRRKGISPVLATVILIAITLIAAIAIAGFVFGLFGTFTKTATVSAASTTITHGAAGVTASANAVVLQNTGTANAIANSMSLTYGGQTCIPTITATTVTAGTTVPVPITATGTCALASTAGEAYTGSVSMSNGGSVLFTGTFS